MTAAVGIAQSGTNNVSWRNRIINGAMVIDQRNAGASVTLSATTQYPVDRFGASKDTAGATCTAQQSSTVPSNFTKSLLWTTTTGAAAGAGDDNIIRQYIEGFNFADLGFGSSAAQSMTLSFWVRSSVTGTYGVSLANSAANRCYMATYTVNAANTWEQKTITVVGDTTGTWVTDNGIGLRIFWDMGSGTSRSIAASSAWGSSYGTGLTGGVKISANTGATFYITGVQLEVGTSATPFEYRDYGRELLMCQRYLPAFVGGIEFLGYWDGSNEAKILVPFEVEARTTPTGVTSSGTFTLHAPGSANLTATAVNFSRGTPTSCRLSCTVASGGLSSGVGSDLYSAAGKILFTGCEL